MKNSLVKRIVSAILAAAMIASLLLCFSGCSEDVFSDYQSDTFELGDQW